MKILLIIMPLIYLGANGYLFFRCIQAMTNLPLWFKIAFCIIFWLAAFSLFLAIGIRGANLPESLLKIMHITGSVWMVFLLYSVLLLAVFDLCHIFIPSLGASLKYALPLCFCLLLYGYINYRKPKVEEIEISLGKDFSGDGFKAVAISDIHLGHGTGPKAMERYVKLINEQKADAIFIAGDLIDNSLKPLQNEAFANALNKLDAPLGIYMVPGNHEFISGIIDCEKYLQEHTEIQLLRDECILLSNGIQVLGRDDLSNKKRKSLNELIAEADSTKPIIVLDHQPYRLAQADQSGMDIQISGHTHRGQVWPLNLLTDAIYEQSHGYRRWPHSHIYVSSGLSLWGPPFRIGSRSDLAVLNLKK